MAELNINEIEELEEINDNYEITVKTKTDILSEINFDSEDDKLLCESIIDSIENAIFNGVRDGLVVSIPFIGCLRKDPIKEKIKANAETFKEIRKCTNKEQYKKYVSDFVGEARNNQKKEDKLKSLLTKIRQKNKKKYDQYYIQIGRYYAELYLKAIYWMDEVPFDEEVQAAFDNANKE